MAFRVAAAQCKKICPERLNWPGRLASISEGHRGISKYFFLDHFSPSFLSQKWCHISVRILCVLPGTKNLQWPILFLYYKESLVSSNLNSKLLWFHSVRPIVHTYIILTLYRVDYICKLKFHCRHMFVVLHVQ